MQAIVMRYNVMSSRVEDGVAIIHVAPFVLQVPIKGTLWPYRRAYTRHVPIEATDIGEGHNLEFNCDYHVALEVKIENGKGSYAWYLAKKFEQLPDNERMRYLGLCRTPAAPPFEDENFICRAVMLHLPSGPVLRDIMIRRGHLYVKNTFVAQSTGADTDIWEDFGEIGDFVINNGTIRALPPISVVEPLKLSDERIIKRLIDGERHSG